jgi:NAD-dependent deacetylase
VWQDQALRSGADSHYALAEKLRSAKQAVIFTGAGISTESGIPDFRSKDGVWTKMAPIEFADYLASAEMRHEAWRRRFAMDAVFTDARPNRGHLAVATLIARGTVSCVITQNIDNLHQDSGISAERIIELHGNTSYAKCLSCDLRVELDLIRAHFATHGEAPGCPACGGILKTATISFGQAMPQRQMARAEAEARNCDLFLVLGSSLVVYPAANLPVLAVRQGAELVIVNRESTPLDGIAALVLRAAIGDTLDGAVRAL